MTVRSPRSNTSKGADPLCTVQLLGEGEYSWHLFIQPHQTPDEHNDDDGPPTEQTLFVSNIPSWYGGAEVEDVFESCGPIQLVVFLNLREESENTVTGMPVRPKRAHVIFTETKSVKKALKQARLGTLDCPLVPPQPESVGITKMLSLYRSRRPGRNALKSQVSHTMANFDKAEAEAAQALRNRQNKVDEDGFILVQRGGGRRKNRNSDGTGASVTATRAIGKDEALKGKDYSLSDFYRFQARQSRREEIAKLRQKFQEDKAKIARMKNNRTFRPY